jgi:hypothetical protein
MGLNVNLPELSRNIELFFKEKICEPSSRDGEPGSASVHGGLAAVASREARRGLGKKEGSSEGSSLRASVAGSMVRRGWRQ